MLPCLSFRKFPRRAGGLLPALLLVTLVSGCETDGYPEDLRYSARTDPIVIDQAKQDATDIDRPGDFPRLFVGLTDEDRGKLLGEVDKVPADVRDKLHKDLEEVFGTPAHPKLTGPGAAAEPIAAMIKALGFDETKLEATLARGSQVYRQQCLHCHGLNGDGRGPTAPWVQPHPRDYRQGAFKFTSSGQDEGRRKPRRDDLLRTVREGIEGTSMPSFRLLPDDDIDAVIAYVVHLSVRGEGEFQFLRSELKGQGGNTLEDYLAFVAGNWKDAQGSTIMTGTAPPPAMNTPEFEASVKRGYALFTQQGAAGCISCHTDFGRQSVYKYDEWGTITRPVDLTVGVYRGGRRPVDLFWRVHSGIRGTGMTAFGAQLQPPQIWDIVNFLEILPYEAMRAKYGIVLENR